MTSTGLYMKTNVAKFFGLGFLLAILPVRALAAGLDHWHWRNPLPNGNSLRGFAYGNGVLVAVGFGGTVQTTTDGTNWTAAERSFSSSLNGVVFGNGKFVAVGSKGAIYTSADGHTWVAQPSGTVTNLLTVSYDNSTFVVGGAGGTVLTSGNAIQWVATNTGENTDLLWSAAGNGKFILPTPPPASAAAWTWPNAKVWVSTNGLNWSLQTVAGGNARLHQIAFANGKFVAILHAFTYAPNVHTFLTMQFVYSSADGVSWVAETDVTPLYIHYSLFTLNNQFAQVIAVQNASNQSIRLSPDGRVWTDPIELPLAHAQGAGDGLVNTPVISAAIFAAGKYFLAGSANTYSGLLFTSTNLTNWSKVINGLESFTTRMAGNQDIMVAVGSAAPSPGTATLGGSPAPILICTNGTSFSVAPLASTQALAGVSFNGTNFIAVGRSGALQSSTNGMHWIVRPSGTASDLASVCYGTNLWVAVGVGGTIVTSPDGLVWTLRSSGTSLNLYDVAFHAGNFVAVGEQGTVLTSPDGLNWTGQYADTLNALLRVTWGNGRYVAIGNAGTVLTSPNGETWTPRPGPTTNQLLGLSYGNGQFLAVGTLSTSINSGAVDTLNQLFSSADGVTWDPVFSPLYQYCVATTFAANTFWVGGDRGALLQSDIVTGQPRLSGTVLGGSYQLTIKGISGQNWRIQTCTNVSGNVWWDTAAITNCQPVENWIDTAPIDSRVKFYRVLAP